jgi:antitoxin YefM
MFVPVFSFAVRPEESPCNTKYCTLECTKFRNNTRCNMRRLKIDQDIKPLSEVRIGIANFIKQVHDTKRPVIITRHGKSVAVLLDVYEYEAIQEKLELLTDVQASLNQLENGQGIAHEDAKERALKRVQK